MGIYIYRKLSATYISILVISMILGFGSIRDVQPHAYSQSFLGWTIFFGMYVALFVIVYGNLISVGIEYLYSKLNKPFHIFYVLLHTIFGALPGLFIEEPVIHLLTIGGAVTATIYALVDRWMLIRGAKNKAAWPVHLLAPAIFVALFGFAFLQNEPLPPFTAEQAVARATEGTGTDIDKFPKEIGINEEVHDNTVITRETSATPYEGEKDTFLVTFKQTTKTGKTERTSSLTYKVDRSTTVLVGNQ